MSNIEEHLDRFGMPEFAFQVKRNGEQQEYYELCGFPNGELPLLALPSDRPSYIYDKSGTLIDWCSDPGESTYWHWKWSRDLESDVEVEKLVDQLSSITDSH